MTKTRGFLLTAGIVLATTFTLSCSGDDGDKDDGSGGGSVSIGGKKYNTVKIDTQTWMAENLNYEFGVNKCYGDDPANCAKYGRLYDWETAMDVCPAGWHLPTDAEWSKLINYVDARSGGSGQTTSAKLRAKNDWNETNSAGNAIPTGTDEYGFSALPGGSYSDNRFSYAGEQAQWWTATEINSSQASYTSIHRTYGGNDVNKSYLYSVRCVKD